MFVVIEKPDPTARTFRSVIRSVLELKWLQLEPRRHPRRVKHAIFERAFFDTSPHHHIIHIPRPIFHNEEMFFNTSAVSSTNLRIDTRLCKLRDTPFAAFFSDVLLFEDM